MRLYFLEHATAVSGRRLEVLRLHDEALLVGLLHNDRYVRLLGVQSGRVADVVDVDLHDVEVVCHLDHHLVSDAANVFKERLHVHALEVLAGCADVSNLLR